MNDAREGAGLKQGSLALEIDEIRLRISLMGRDGSKAPIVFLHGFGSTKEDFADIAFHEHFHGHAVIAYDAPGCGRSFCDHPDAIDISFLKDTAKRMISHFAVHRFHLVGHSMGGLTALLLAQEVPESVLSFVNIEGNLAPEDCFLSRQILEFTGDDPGVFFEQFIDGVGQSGDFASALYAAHLWCNVRVGAVHPIFTSMVELSDHGDLLRRFIELPCPRLFMYGHDNRSLPYLGPLQDAGVALAEIPHCGHFPMYSNPPAMWCAISEFIGGVKREKSHE